MSNLSDLLPAGGSGKTVELVASGTLANGNKVILQSDGTAKVVALGTVNVPTDIPAGSSSVFNPGVTDELSISFDQNTAGKFVIVYVDTSNSWLLTAIVGTVSGTSISFGSEVIIQSNSASLPSVSFDPNTAGKFIIAYRDSGNSGYGTAVVGTVSGTTFSLGTKYVFNPGTTYVISASFDPNTAGKFVVSYKDGGNSGYGTAVVGTVSGTSISFGSESVFNTGIINMPTPAISFDPNTAGKFVIAYRDSNDVNKGKVVVGTISGTSISFGSEVIFNNSNWTYWNSVSFDPNTANKFVVAYRDEGNSNYGTSVVGTVSGTSISFGTEVVFNSASTEYISCRFDPNTVGRFLVTYRDDGNSYYGTAVIGTVSGTSLSFGSEIAFNLFLTVYIIFDFDPNTAGTFVIAYRDMGGTNYGTAVLGQLDETIIATNLTATNFIGTSEGAFADTATATVMLRGGITTTQSGLTTGSKYYVQGDGTLSTTPDSPSVTAGKALSATTLLIGGSS